MTSCCCLLVQRTEARAHSSKMAAESVTEIKDTLNKDKHLSSGLMYVIKPSIEALDKKVNDVR